VVEKRQSGRTGRKRIHVSTRPDKPVGAGTLTKYDDIRAKAVKFAEGKYNLFVLTGPPGISKTTVFKKALEEVAGPENFLFIEANASPFGTYCKLWQHRNKLVVLDDADQLNEQPAGKRLLKQLGQSEQWKRLSWETKAMTGKQAPAPSEFFTESKVCIITNKWEFRQGDVHTAAVEDRGQCYLFDPPALEVHHYTSGWFWDQEIYDEVARNLPYLRSVTCRLYFKLDQMKRAGDDWREYLLQHVYDEEDVMFKVQRLLMDKTFKSNNERGTKFQADGLGRKSTFYRYANDIGQRYKLKELPAYTVKGTLPTQQPDPMQGLEVDEDESEDEDEADGEED